MEQQDTIVAISTPVGRGGIGVVRLSGPRARAVVEPLLRLRHPLAAGRARFGVVIDAAGDDHAKAASRGITNQVLAADAAVLDEAVITFFAAPNSYTGEDVVEIAAHGAPVLLEYIVRQCCAGGARLAEPGEFTQRAFLAGRIDLTQAEAVDDLIGSSTLEQARVAARQMGGALARRVAPVKAQLVALISAMEAGIDFAEDDIDVLPAASIAAKIAEVRAPLAALERSFAYGRVVRDGFRLAIVGRPNAGKSSLFNRLVERDRAIVTATPGTTRDLVTERVSIAGIPVDLIDTAGLREGTDEAERMGIAKSHEAMADADVVLLVVDRTLGIGDEDRAVLERGALLAWNKTDLVATSKPQPGVVPGTPGEAEPSGRALPDTPPCTIKPRQDSAPGIEDGTTDVEDGTPDTSDGTHDLQVGTTGPAAGRKAVSPAALQNDNRAALQDDNRAGLRNGPQKVVRTSALTGEGIADLRAAIVAAVAGDAGGVRETAMLTNLRQHQAVTQALGGLDAAHAAVESAIPHEMVMLDLYEALHGLDALTGVTTSEDILRLIFSKFCIGK